LGFTRETIEQELQHAAKLSNKNRGELAELAFMRKAATLGFSVAKPWGESERYDVVVRCNQILWRVQLKSVWHISPSRNHYRIRTVNWMQLPYTADAIDFLVAYVFAEDIWYVFPVRVVENRKAICVVPNSKRSRIEQYREAWKLMRENRAETAIPEQTAGDSEEITTGQNASQP